MKILMAHPGPQFSVHDVHVGWTEALGELGNQVAEFNLGERLTFYDSALLETPGEQVRKALSSEDATQLAVNGLYAALYRLRPEVLFITYPYFYPQDLFALARSYGTVIVVMHTECPYEDERQLKIAARADLNLINDPASLESFRAVNPHTYYMPHSYRPDFHRPGTPDADYTADLAFVGTGYPSRIKFFEAMDLGGLDVFLAGNWNLLDDDSPLRKFVAHDVDDCLDNEQTAKVYQSSRIGMNLYRREVDLDNTCDDAGTSMGPREVEMAACRMFFLRESRPEGDEVLWMLPKFETPEEVPELARWWLDHDKERHEIATQARSAIKDRTFKNRAAELMRLLEKGR